MKTTTKVTLCVWAWLFWLALLPAQGFYDPGAQRWLNRDPINEMASQSLPSHWNTAKRGHYRKSVGLREERNLYQFVENSPGMFVDPVGLSYGIPVSGPKGPVGPSSPHVPGWSYYPDGYRHRPATPSPDPCVVEAAAEFKTCMQSFAEGLCLREAYENLHGAMQATEWSMALFGALYGGGAIGCAAKAIGAYNACVVDNLP